jgi:uncharacterized protein YbjT (DUF2867 family)
VEPRASEPGTVLVTGATGFVGGHLVRKLLADRRQIRALVRSEGSGAGLAAAGCELAIGDVTDPMSLERACQGVDAIAHLVAIIEGRSADFERVMAQGTRNLVEAAGNARVRRFVLMSALGVSAETAELTPYYRAKWDMERAVKASGQEHVIFRPSFVFAGDGGVLPTFMRLVKLSPLTPVLGPGTTRLQPIWADDLAAFLAAAIDRPEAADRTFELGGPDAVSWDELYAAIARVLAKRRTRLHLPFALAKSMGALLGWAPGFPFTADQVRMLAAGNNVADLEPAYEAFGLLQLMPLEEQLRLAADRAAG